MDQYSELIINAVEKNKNAVVKIDKYQSQRGKLITSGSGSGFVFSSDGLIFTNHHVIQDARRLEVTLLDGSVYQADKVGSDPDSDIGIIKIYESGYSVSHIGTSLDLQIGQLLIAIGNPMGFQHSVSVGVLSGIGRTMRTPSGKLIDDVLQSDVSLNPGNSGGPMINTEGNVIGINTAVIQGAQGISFTIAIDTAKEIAGQLIKNGKIIKAYLGLMIQEIQINPRIRNFHHLENKMGLMIIGFENKSPASRANLREGDIIVEFDGKQIRSSIELFKKLSSDKIFEPTKMKILRQTKLMEVDIFPSERRAG